MALGFSEAGEPLVLAWDWTAPPFVPSDLAEPRIIGRASWSNVVVEYDDDGEPFEVNEWFTQEWGVRPDGTAWSFVEHGTSVEIREWSPGEWECDPFTLWPSGFGSRSGCKIQDRREAV